MDGKNQRLILKMGFSSTNTRGQSSGRVKPGRGQRDASRIKTRPLLRGSAPKFQKAAACFRSVASGG